MAQAATAWTPARADRAALERRAYAPFLRCAGAVGKAGAGAGSGYAKTGACGFLVGGGQAAVVARSWRTRHPSPAPDSIACAAMRLIFVRTSVMESDHRAVSPSRSPR